MLGLSSRQCSVHVDLAHLFAGVDAAAAAADLSVD